MATPPPSPPPDDDARWLAALAARIEDDPALLDALPDEDVDAMLAAENARPGAVAAGIRRRLREAERAPARVHRMPRWRWPVTAGVLAVAALAAIWIARPAPSGDAAETVLAYRTELAAFAQLAAPPTKGAPNPVTVGGRDLLAAAEAEPPDTALARRAAEALAAAPDSTGEAAFFAGLAYRLAGDADAADRWFRRVPPESPYAEAARAER